MLLTKYSRRGPQMVYTKDGCPTPCFGVTACVLFKSKKNKKVSKK